jgi:hypothetical protein
VIRLIRADVELPDAALASDSSLAKALDHEVVAGWATFRKALEVTRDALIAEPSGSAWGTRFFVAVDPPELVGWGGFKGPPKTALSRSPKPGGGAVSRPRRPGRCSRRHSPMTGSRR